MKIVDVVINVIYYTVITACLGFAFYVVGDSVITANRNVLRLEEQEYSILFLAEENIELNNLIYDMQGDFDEDIELVREDIKSDKLDNELNFLSMAGAIDNNFITSFKRHDSIHKIIGNILNATEFVINDIKKPSYDYLKSVTVVMLNTSPSRKSLGTGVILENSDDGTYILTNNHVCSDFGLCIVKVDNKKYLARIIKRSQEYDMLLVRVHGWIKGKSQVKGYHEVNQQDKVFTVGHGLGRPCLYGEGTVAGYDEDDLVISLPVINGSSGSGVFDQNGYLVGLVFAIRLHQTTYGGVIPDPGHGYCVDGKHIKEFLRGIVLDK